MGGDFRRRHRRTASSRLEYLYIRNRYGQVRAPVTPRRRASRSPAGAEAALRAPPSSMAARLRYTNHQQRFRLHGRADDQFYNGEAERMQLSGQPASSCDILATAKSRHGDATATCSSAAGSAAIRQQLYLAPTVDYVEFMDTPGDQFTLLPNLTTARPARSSTTRRTVCL